MVGLIPALAVAIWRVWLRRRDMYNLACWSVMCVPGTADLFWGVESRGSPARRHGVAGTPLWKGGADGGASLRSGYAQPPACPTSPSRLTPKAILIVAAQEAAVHALHLLQSCLVHVNTLMLQRVLAEPAWGAHDAGGRAWADAARLGPCQSPMARSISTWSSGSTSTCGGGLTYF